MHYLPDIFLSPTGDLVITFQDVRPGLELRSAEREQTEIDWRKHLLYGMHCLGLERPQKPRGDREGE